MTTIDEVNNYWRRKWARMTPQQRRYCLDRAEGEKEQLEFTADHERIFYNIPRGRRL